MINFLQYFIDFIELFFIFFIVLPYEGGVRIRLGKYVTVFNPGIHFRFPLAIDKVIKTNVALETIDLPAQAIITKDNKSIVVSGIASFKIIDVKKFLIEVEDAASVLKDSSRGVIRQILTDKTLEEILTLSKKLDTELTKAVRKEAERWGIHIQKISLSDLTTAKTLRLLISNDEQKLQPSE